GHNDACRCKPTGSGRDATHAGNLPRLSGRRTLSCRQIDIALSEERSVTRSRPVSSCDNGICIRASSRNTVPAQPVGATPSDMNSFSKGGVYGTRKTEQAFHGAENGDVAPLEGSRVVTCHW